MFRLNGGGYLLKLAEGEGTVRVCVVGYSVKVGMKAYMLAHMLA